MNIPGRPSFPTNAEYQQRQAGSGPAANDYPNGSYYGARHNAAFQRNDSGGGGSYQLNDPYRNFSDNASDIGSLKNEPLTVDSSDGVPLLKHDSESSLSKRMLECDYCHRFRGITFAILSALFFSFQALLVAKIRHVHFTQITFFRMVVQALCITPCVLIKKQSFIGPKDERLKLLFRGIFGTISMGGMYYAIQRMPLGEASVIRFSCPAFVAIMAFFILKESCGIFEFIIIILTFSGVVLIAQPPFVFSDLHKAVVIDAEYNSTLGNFTYLSQDNTTTDVPLMNLSAVLSDVKPKQVILTSVEPGREMTIEGRLLGSATALVAAVAGSGVHILLRQLRTVDAGTVIFTYSVIGATVSAFLATCFQGWTFMLDWQTWLEQFAVGIFAVIAQLCFTWALQEENAGTVSVLRTTEILFAFIYQTVLLHLYPNVYSILGAILITCCAVAHGVRKWYVTRMEFENLEEVR